MSNVKEAYNLVFGPEGSKRTNRVLNSLYREGLPEKLDLLGSYGPRRGGPQFIIMGDFPFTLRTLQTLTQ